MREKFRRRIGRIRRTGSEGEKDQEREGERIWRKSELFQLYSFIP